MTEQSTDLPPDPELPRGVALAWGIAANPQRGPKRELSIERIVDAAVELADAGGIGAVSMSAVASALGFTPMSLYRYVTAKDDLVLLMQEQGVGVPPESIIESAAGGWRPGLDAWATAMTDVYLRHPWLLDIAVSGTPVTPNNLSWLEVALQVLESVPVALNDKVSVVLALIGQARWESLTARGIQAEAAATGVSPGDLDMRDTAILSQLLTPEGYPLVHEALVAGVFSGEGERDGGDPFAFGRDRVLDGIESYLASAPKVDAVKAPSDPIDKLVEREPKVKEAASRRREVEGRLREARKREREARAAARERLRRK